jgi:WD40 repeat protein
MSLAFSPSSEWLASGGDDATVRLWHIADPHAESVELTDTTHRASGLAFSPDGLWLIAVSVEGTVRRWDTRDVAAEPLFANKEASIIHAAVTHPRH